MRTNIQRFRWLGTRLPSPTQLRLVVLTGARQTGKTTLARSHYGSLRYVNLDSIEEREALRNVRTSAWPGTVGPAVLDEAQKEPSIFEKVKWAFGEKELDFTVLLGSSRILLLDRIKETLAGRAFLYDLWPLMASELRQDATGSPERPLLDRLLAGPSRAGQVLGGIPSVLLGREESSRHDSIEHLASWGGMPGLLPLSDEDRLTWLDSYQQTFLERDLTDLVRLSDLHPFLSLQEHCMLRSGQLLSYAELARDAGLAPGTARRYLEYLCISYQTILLRPYARNLTSRVVKAPKLYWVDLGLLRQGTRQWGSLTGSMFETLVVGEVHKWVRTMSPDVRLFFYRTRSGMEVDLLVQTPHGLLGIEVKNHTSVSSSDARALRALARELGSQWLGGLLVHRGGELAPIAEEHGIWAVPLHRLV